MQKAVTQLLVVLLMAMALAGCTVVGGIFKAGFAVGIFVVVIIVVVLFMLFGRR